MCVMYIVLYEVIKISLLKFELFNFYVYMFVFGRYDSVWIISILKYVNVLCYV